ncbi:MAG: amidohydrolase family protein [Hyphomicrobiales bacterium]|nr:amidohydrolase family protein [Hyphomicrobiales bacterium]
MTIPPTIDAHHHLWDTATNQYPWLEGEPFDAHFGNSGDLPRPYTLDDYLADAAGQNIVKSVHVEASHDPADPVRETWWLQGLADQRGFPHAIVGFADLTRADVQATLEAHAESANFRGIRMSTMTPAQLREAKGDVRSKMSESAWRDGFKVLGDMGLSFDLQAPAPLMAEAAEVAAAFPDTPILLTHAGLPLDRSEAGMDAWRRGMRLMAERPNIALKVTGVPMTDWNWTVESLRPIVLEAIDIFGVERSMFGSNFPIDGLHSSFGTLFDAYRVIVDGFSDDEQRAMFHDNAARSYRI